MAEVPVDTRIARAVDAVYRQLQGAPPETIEGCPCCIANRGVDALLNRPLRDLTGAQLSSYVSGVFYTVGSIRDFRYLLPRILDLAINDPGSSNCPEIVLGKIGLADWQSWPAAECATIEELVEAWLELAVMQDMTAHRAGDISRNAEAVLCGAARVGLLPSRYREILLAPAAAPVLTDMRARYPHDLSAFWDDAPQGMAELAALIGH